MPKLPTLTPKKLLKMLAAAGFETAKTFQKEHFIPL